MIQKIRRRIAKSILQYGTLATIGRCLLWPLMYLGWRIVELSPQSRKARRDGEEFDRLFGVDTERDRAAEWAADIDSPNWADGLGYDPTPPDVIRETIARLSVRHEDFVFIDVGSGKGRVLLVASEFPFDEVLGVEYAPDLNEIAERNIAVFNNPEQRCKRIRSHCADATVFELPTRPLVLFFAHPFGEAIVREFFASLESSLKRVPRKIFIVYYDPICGALLREGSFRERSRKPLSTKRLLPAFVYRALPWFETIGFRNDEEMEYVIYESVDPAPGSVPQETGDSPAAELTGIRGR